MNRRTITWILLAAMLCGAVGCGESQPEPDGGSDTSASVVTSAKDELALQLPADLNYQNKTVKIYTRGDNLVSEFDAEETGDVVDDAIYNRNLAIEERLHVKLEYFANTTEFWADRNIYMDTVRTSIMANDNSIDIVAGLSLVMPTLAGEGLFLNLLNMDYLDFTKPWWNKSLLEELAVEDRLYSATGDASLGLIKGVICMYFNKDIITANKMEDPYSLVESGKWTIDKFHEMTSGSYQDLNGSGAADDGDQFGFEGLDSNHLVNFFYGCGLRITEKDTAGQISFSLGSEKAADALTKIADILREDACLTAGSKKSVTSAKDQLFMNGQALFDAAQFSTAELLRDTDFSYGIIPFPKYDENQEGYYTHARNTMTGFAIPITSDAEMCSAVLEAMAWESWKTVTPAYYEKAMKVKYSQDDTTSQMLDLIKNGICYDFGMWHYLIFSKAPSSMIKTVYEKADASTWMSTYASNIDVMESDLAAYIDKLLSLEY